MKEMIIAIGNIGSGKSTYINRYYSYPPHVYISRDSIRYMFGNNEYLFEQTLEPLVKIINLDMVSLLCSRGRSFVCDDTYITKDDRKRVLSLGNMYDYKKTALVFPRLSMKESVGRRMNNPHNIPEQERWESVWKKFDSIYEEPTKEEGFDEIIKIKKSEIGI